MKPAHHLRLLGWLLVSLAVATGLLGFLRHRGPDASTTGKTGSTSSNSLMSASIRPARSETSDYFRSLSPGPSQGSAFAPRRLTYTFGENLALINPTIAPLADLAAFSVQLLLRRQTSRTKIFELNRQIKAEAFSQHYKETMGFHPRSAEQLRRFINEGYDSLESPDLLKIRLMKSGIEMTPLKQEIVWTLGQRAELPMVIANQLDVTSQVRIEVQGSQQSIAPLALAAQETRSYFLACIPQRSGKQTQTIKVSTDLGTAAVDLALEVRKSVRLKMNVLDELFQPTAARTYVTGSDGLARAPEGSFLRVVGADYKQPFAGDSYFYADGAFELDLPEGKTVVEAVKGFEYEPARQELDLKPGATNHTLHFKRIINMAEEGWYSGETHIHANVINNEIINPEDVWLQIRGEDLNVANLLVSNTVQGVVHDRKYFEGSPHRLSKGKHLLYWNEEMRNAGLFGHMAFLNLKRLVEPFYTGFHKTQWSDDYPANYEQAMKAKAQGAVVTQVHPSAESGEYPVDLALGAMDALDVMSQADEETVAETWYKLLNCGLRCSISAGTDSFLNVMYFLIPGANRVYVKTGPTLSYGKWIQGYKQGNSFATNGPLLFLSLNGREPGADIRLAKSGTLRVEATASSLVPMDNLEIIMNGEVVASVPAAANRQSLKFSGDIAVDQSSWIAARVNGEAHRFVPNDRRLFAHTSPVYCYLGDRKIASKKDAEFFVLWIDKLIKDVEEKGKFSSPKQRAEVVQLFRRGQEVYKQVASDAR